jgi:hypothetical protein
LYAFATLPNTIVGSRNIRNAASAVPDIQVYKPLLPSRSLGRKALATSLPNEYLAAFTLAIVSSSNGSRPLAPSAAIFF